ncbi:MAG: 50S ribosomal protein L25 [Chloroflexi bacterium]|nr:50S ribosomal protein L25 [Chloroflexota bacterium]
MPRMLDFAAQSRDNSAKAKALLRKGIVPGVIYGRGFEPRSLQFEYLLVDRMTRQAGTSHLISLTIEGDPEAHMVLIRDVQHEPVTGRIMHVDLYRVVAGEEIRSQIPIVLVGEAPIVHRVGATVTQALDSIEVQCVPADMPESIEVDLRVLTDLDSRITVGDLQAPPNVTILTDPDAEIVQVAAPRAMEEEEVEAEEAVLAEAKEGEAAEETESETRTTRPGPAPRT